MLSLAVVAFLGGLLAFASLTDAFHAHVAILTTHESAIYAYHTASTVVHDDSGIVTRRAPPTGSAPVWATGHVALLHVGVAANGAADGVSLTLKYKDGWSAAQRAAADAKVARFGC
jgi:hypothetical protein